MRPDLKRGLRGCTLLFLLVMVPAFCWAFGGKVSYPDGTPAVGAQVKLVGGVTATCDQNGRFLFDQVPPDVTQIQIQAPDGKDYATVMLPAALFQSGETAIVLHQK
jgi:hypothetical protein